LEKAQWKNACHKPDLEENSEHRQLMQLVSSSDADSPQNHAEKFGFSTNKTEMLCFDQETCPTGTAAVPDLQINPAKITVTKVGTHSKPQLV
jgi:hypothetical protein